jgi:SSS family solute:Na+ symporter
MFSWSATLALLAALLPAARAVSPAPLHAYLGATPLLDGVLQPAEWADATPFASIQAFDANFSPVQSALDLDISGFVKHDGKRLYFAFNITDDLLYYLQTPKWLPAGNAQADNLTRAGWPWFGDEVELLINAPGVFSDPFDEPTGTPGVFQMVCNLHKSRLGGAGVGGLLEGEPRSSDTAWANYQQWIYARTMECAVRALPGAGPGSSSVYGMEWAVDFDPLLQIAPGRFWNASQGAVEMGLNIALGDTDTPAEGDPTFGLRHEMWWAGNTSCQGHGNCHTLLSYFGTLVMEPGPRPGL